MTPCNEALDDWHDRMGARCLRPAGHDLPHRTFGGVEWPATRAVLTSCEDCGARADGEIRRDGTWVPLCSKCVLATPADPNQGSLL